MEFVQSGNQIDCVRISRDRERGVASRRVVVSFDAHLETIAPHVKGLLKRTERRQLQQWLEDRRSLKAKPTEQTVLETLPSLLTQAGGAIGQLPVVDEKLFAELELATDLFRSALDAKRTDTAPMQDTALEEMGNSEALKHRIEQIKKGL